MLHPSTDGVWAPHWYAAVEASSELQDQRLADLWRPYYDRLPGYRLIP